jgi:NAD(P)-dependent dehydrogenase (short-subunit alcohol dehydrogenase family)
MAVGELAGKVAVITGATGGIGAAIARRFAREGTSLVLAGRSRDRADALAAELRAADATVDVVIGDIRTDACVDALTDLVSREYGRIDVLVLNAGAITFAPTCDITPEQYDEMMAVNVRAPWMCVRGMHSLLADGASIVVTSSVSATTHFPGETVYCMSKAALTPLVQGLAIELGQRGIRVNALCPGVIGEAGMSQDAMNSSADPAAEATANAVYTPLARLGALAEIADATVFLASDQSSFITGTSLVIDGGLTIPRIS